MMPQLAATATPKANGAVLRPVLVGARHKRGPLRPSAALPAWAPKWLSKTSSPSKESQREDELIERLFSLCEGTDGGARASVTAVNEIEEIIQALEDEFGCEDALNDENLFGNFVVAYTSNPTAAGGPFRTQLGRAIFKTEEGSLTQSVDPSGKLTNGVDFKLFGIFPGKVSLEGEIAPKGPSSFDIEFQPPELRFGNRDPITFGKNTTVPLLTVTYLEKRLRLARGNRGSRFVFKRI